MDDPQILERLGHGLSTGDLDAVAECWETPALVLADEGAMPLQDAAQIRAIFAQAVAAYRARGLVSTRPEIHPGPNL